MEEQKNRVRDVSDFEYWRNLAKTDPQGFESAREQAIADYIAGLPIGTRDRMRRLQWRIDMERQRARNPMDAAIRIYDMMWESVGKSMEALEVLAEAMPGAKTSSTKGKKPKPPEVAKVLPFRQQATGTNS